MFDDVQLVFRSHVVGGEVLHNGMVFRDNLDWVFGLMVVTLAGHAQELAPVVDLRGSISVHRTVNHNRVGTFFVRLGNFPNVVGIACASEAFVVDDAVVALSPMGVVVELQLRTRAGSSLMHDRPVDDDVTFFRGFDQLLSLVRVVVAAPVGDDQDVQWLFFCVLCEEK